jgi:hypothetical protein
MLLAKQNTSRLNNIFATMKAKKTVYQEVGKMGTYGMGGRMKKYLTGGVVPEKKNDFVGKGLFPKDPAAKGGDSQTEYLERLTWQKSLEALDRRGVSMVDQAPGSKKILGQGNRNILDNNYELAIKKAKEYGVYNEARQEAVRQYREEEKKKASK